MSQDHIDFDEFERATALLADRLAYFRDEENPVPTENEKLTAGHLIGALAANKLLGDVLAERERCAKIAEYQGMIPDRTEVQRAHIYCANAIAAAIRKQPR